MPEGRLAEAFVELADTLVSDYDVMEFLHRLCEHCENVLTVAAAGVLLADTHGDLRLSCASSEQMRVLELFELQQQQGPCPEAFRSGRQVHEPDLERARPRWPEFTPRALDVGFRSVYAFPLRLRDQCIGALNTFRAEPGAFANSLVTVAQALADVATIGILQQRTVQEARRRSEQLQEALHSRVAIEQAKGMVAAHLGISIDEAFERIRRYARNRNRRLSEVAREIIDDVGRDIP